MVAFVKKPSEMRHTCGMVKKFLTNIMFINIAYLCVAVFQKITISNSYIIVNNSLIVTV
jgi:hypothetical protein